MTAQPRYSHGAERLTDGRVRFRLWAPGATDVLLHVEGDAVPMQKEDGGWFEAWRDCPAGTGYCFGAGGGGRGADSGFGQQGGDGGRFRGGVGHAGYGWGNEGRGGRPWGETVLDEGHPGLVGGFE